MSTYEYLDTSDTYSYGLDLSALKQNLQKTGKNKKTPVKRYVVLDLEMTEFSPSQRSLISGAHGEVIQFGAVMLDQNYNMISKFSSYVKPLYSSVTPFIQELTGISNEVLEHADDFITVFDKYSYWRGEGDITTFCWSTSDHNQLWSELSAKAHHRHDLFDVLKDFVDLQRVFSKLMESRGAVSLDSAMRLLQMDFEGKIHSAYSDSYNTARILHKLFCTESLDISFDYINPKDRRRQDLLQQKENYTSSFASFMSPELLARFGYQAQTEELEEVNAESEVVYCTDEDLETLKDSALAESIDAAEIKALCNKYKIAFPKWMNLAAKLMTTGEMQVA